LISHGVFVARIIAGFPEKRFEIFQIGKFGMIQRLDQVLVDQHRHDVIGRDDDVILAGPTGLQFGHHLLVVLVYVQSDLDAELFFEIGRHLFLIHILRPRVDPEFLGTGRHPAQKHQYHYEQTNFTHLFSPF
jgi:hypothetical protein